MEKVAELRGLAPHPTRWRDRSLSRRRRHAGPVENSRKRMTWWPRRDLHPQLIDFKSIASSVGPRGQCCEMVRTAGLISLRSIDAVCLRLFSAARAASGICTCNIRLLRSAPLLVGLRVRCYEMVPPVGIAPTWSPLREECLATIQPQRI